MSVCMSVYENISIPDNAEIIIKEDIFENKKFRYIDGIKFNNETYIPDFEKNKFYIKQSHKFNTKNRRIKRENNKLPYKIFNTKIGTVKICLLNEIFYTQGWFLNKRFFNKTETIIICTTKKEFINFWNNYIDHKNNKYDFKERKEYLYNFMQNNFIEGKHIFTCYF